MRAKGALGLVAALPALAGCPSYDDSYVPRDASLADVEPPRDVGAGDGGAGPPEAAVCDGGCEGGGCNAGVCGPLPTLVASGFPTPSAIAVDATNLYVTANGTSGGVLVAIPLAGGPPAMLASEGRKLIKVAVDGTRVYWGAHDQANVWSVLAVPLAGGPPQTLASGITTSVLNLAVAPSGVYAADFDHASILRIPLDGGAPAPFASGQASSIAVTARTAYWADVSGRLVAAPTAGGAPVPLATQQAGISAVAVDTAAVYWATAGTEDGGYAGGVFALGADAAAPVLLAPASYAFGLAAGGANIYWRAYVLDVFEVPKSGGPARMIASGQSIVDLSADDAFVYWANTDGTIWKQAR
jgi:hypothetical protein